MKIHDYDNLYGYDFAQVEISEAPSGVLALDKSSRVLITAEAVRHIRYGFYMDSGQEINNPTMLVWIRMDYPGGD